MIRTLFLSIIIICQLFSQEVESTYKPALHDSRTPELTDSLIPTIPGESDTLAIEEQLIRDSLAMTTDSTLADETLEPVQQGFSFGVSWGFTSSDIFKRWGNNQQKYKDDVKQYLSDSGYNAQTSWFQEPREQSIAFPLSIAAFRRLDTLRSITWGMNYAFRTQKATFASYEDSTNNLLFQSDSRLSHHRIDIFGAMQFRINPEYFSINGVDATGFGFGGGFIPLSLFKLTEEANSEISNIEAKNRNGYTYGVGATWSATLFTEKQLSPNSQVRLFFNYNGSYHYGFKNSDELFSRAPEEQWNYSPMSFTETFLELGFLLTFGKENGVDEK